MPIFNTEYKSFEQGWQPGANTLAYWKLNGNLNDSSGNGYNGTWSTGTAKYATLSSGIQVAEFSGGLSRVTTSFSGTPKTVSVWAYKSTTLGDQYPNGAKQIIGQNSSDGGNGWVFRMMPLSGNPSVFYQDGSYPTYCVVHNTSYQDKWIHYLATVDGNTTKFYVNGTYIGSINKVINVSTTLWMGTAPYDTWDNYTLYGYLSEAILEDKSRTAQKISDYYNSTKSNYGL